MISLDSTEGTKTWTEEEMDRRTDGCAVHNETIYHTSIDKKLNQRNQATRKNTER